MLDIMFSPFSASKKACEKQNQLFFQNSILDENFKDLNKWDKESEAHLDYCHRTYNSVYLGYQIRDFLSKSSVVENAFCGYRAESEVLRLWWIYGGFRRM